MIVNLKIFFAFIILSQTPVNIIGTWKLVSYDAIENIRLSPGYINADDYSRNQMEKQFELILSKGGYIFSENTLRYTDLNETGIKYRQASYRINADTLFINEKDRDFRRKAFIRFLSSDSLVLSPVIEKKVSSSKLTFKKK